MLQNFFGVLIMFLMAAGVSVLFIFLSENLGPKKPNAAKAMPYECGKVPFDLPTGKHSVRFYIAAMLFVLFDVEIIFFFPWAVVLREIGAPALWAMFLFLIVLELAFAYAWRKGALQWK